MRKRCMDAYYYGFDATGSETIDKILGAVACAGKSYHHTENWDEEVCVYDDHTGKTPTEWIQNAAIEAAAEIARLREALSSLVEAWDWWQVDPYDRCQSVPSDAINEARAALAEMEEK